MKRERRKARTLALQTLYEVDCVGHSAEAVIARHIDENSALRDEGVTFFRQLVLGTLQLATGLDRLIAESAPEWPVGELAVIDRNILRLAIWEFAFSGQTPLKVAINEAVELAKLFGSDSAPRFVNGVLGTLAEREDEIRRQLSLMAQG